ncbi:hypothetical protein D1871_05715 [Nakamurella silvestris]|nr:hypothetical protein D1871_05715 [Nakamurella silvestris]
MGIGARKMNVVITNSSTADLDILTADLTSGYLQKAVEPYRDGTVRAGAALALAFTLPAAICTPGATADPSVTIRYRSAGVEGTMTVVPVDTYGALEDVHRTDCAVDEIASLATLSFADELKVVDRDGTSTALLSLTLTPKATDRTLVVTELERTTLLVPAGTATWKPQGLNNSHGKPVTVDLEVIPARCDPHAVAEDKRGTFLGTHVTVDGQELPVVFTEIPQHTKGLIYQYVSDYCGW